MLDLNTADRNALHHSQPAWYKKTQKGMLLYENNDFVFLFRQQQFAKANKF